MSYIQMSLFDEISSRNSTTYNEVNIEKTLKLLKQYIASGVINESDTYFNIAYEREPKIISEDGVYELKFAHSSDSERLLTAYEHNPDIEPMGLLGVGAAKGALNSIKKYISEYPKASTKEILEHFSIFDYPTYRWTHAQSTSLEEINTVKQLIIDWAKLKERLQLDLSEGKYTFMRLNKRSKTDDQTTVIPQCFDGMCLEKNFMKIISEANKIN